MSIPVIAFFNNKGGVGKTSLVYHLSFMYADLGVRVLAADFDPQSNLSAAFLKDDRLESLFASKDGKQTIFGCLDPLIAGIGDISDPKLEIIADNLALVPGDMQLSAFEDELSEAWPKCLGGTTRAFRVTSAFWRILQSGAREHDANLILIDLGPNLGAINRAALIAADYVVIPLGPDLFSLQGLRNLGPALRRWRKEWNERLAKNSDTNLELPRGVISPIGYILLRHSIRLDRPVKAFDRWMEKIPGEYLESVLDNRSQPVPLLDNDSNCIAKLKDYRSLMPLAQEVHKPMFFLKPGDGALGAHGNAVKDVYWDFRNVAVSIAQRIQLEIPKE